MKTYIILMVLFSSFFINAQVGINTTDPQATLDINGNLVIRTAPITTAMANYDFLVINSVSNEVQRLNGNLGTSVSNPFSATMVKAVEENGISLLDGTLFAGWQKINFGPGHIPINPGSNFDSITDHYTVPSDGIYEVNYEVRYGTGVMLSALNFGGTPSIGILKHTGSGYTVLDERKFSGATVPLLVSILVSSTQIDNMYQLASGDKLSFEMNAGGLTLGLLSSSYASVVIRKISD